MRLKHAARLLIALLLLATLALPAFAAPTTNEATTTNVAEESSEARYLSEDEVQSMISSAIAGLQPEPTDIMPFDEGAAETEGQAEVPLSQYYMTLAALGLGGFAVLLSIVALARTKKKSAPNATGNYQKYF